MLPKSLKNVLLFTVGLLVISTGVAISQLVAHHYSVSLLEGAAARAENMARNLALEAADKILINDLVSLQKMLDDQISSNPSVSYLFITREKNLLAHTFLDGFPSDLISANFLDKKGKSRLEKLRSHHF